MENLSNMKQEPIIRPVRDLRNNFAEIAKIIDGHHPVFITNNGRGTAVLINIEDYADYEKYLYEKYALKMLDESEQYAVNETVEWHDFDDDKKEKRERLIPTRGFHTRPRGGVRVIKRGIPRSLLRGA